tara:strand:+ start:2311 stop:2814 length:504 start_codon:yes stop_codon:yes gene_type:complete
VFTTILSLGSNLNDRLANLSNAIEMLSVKTDVLSISPVYETQPLYILEQPLFLNLAILATTELSATTLLDFAKNTENIIGRQPTTRFGPRIVDIDIIDYDSRCLNNSRLTLPHPRVEERLFVLKPLLDIVPKWTHPKTKQNLKHMIDQLPANQTIKLFGHIPLPTNT